MVKCRYSTVNSRPSSTAHKLSQISDCARASHMRINKAPARRAPQRSRSRLPPNLRHLKDGLYLPPHAAEGRRRDGERQLCYAREYRADEQLYVYDRHHKRTSWLGGAEGVESGHVLIETWAIVDRDEVDRLRKRFMKLDKVCEALTVRLGGAY